MVALIIYTGGQNCHSTWHWRLRKQPHFIVAKSALGLAFPKSEPTSFKGCLSWQTHAGSNFVGTDSGKYYVIRFLKVVHRDQGTSFHNPLQHATISHVINSFSISLQLQEMIGLSWTYQSIVQRSTIMKQIFKTH